MTEAQKTTTKKTSSKKKTSAKKRTPEQILKLRELNQRKYQKRKQKLAEERERKTRVEEFKILEEKNIIPTKTPAPEKPTTIKRPNIMSGRTAETAINMIGRESEIHSGIDERFGDIGYFILAEQMLPTRNRVKLVQLKLDTGEFVNLFFNI